MPLFPERPYTTCGRAINRFNRCWVRLELTNRFGEAPVTLSHVTVAEDGGGALIVPSSLRTVTFGDSPSVTIPAGADTLSDPFQDRVSEDKSSRSASPSADPSQTPPSTP